MVQQKHVYVTLCFFETPSFLGEKWQSNKFDFSNRVKNETKANIKMKDERMTNPYSDIKANMLVEEKEEENREK